MSLCSLSLSCLYITIRLQSRYTFCIVSKCTLTSRCPTAGCICTFSCTRASVLSGINHILTVPGLLREQQKWRNGMVTIHTCQSLRVYMPHVLPNDSKVRFNTPHMICRLVLSWRTHLNCLESHMPSIATFSAQLPNFSEEGKVKYGSAQIPHSTSSILPINLLSSALNWQLPESRLPNKGVFRPNAPHDFSR